MEKNQEQCTNIMFLDIIRRPLLSKHRLAYISKYSFSETGFCLRLQVKANQLDPTARPSSCLRRYRLDLPIGPNCVGST
jgi:hypothetical protein